MCINVNTCGDYYDWLQIHQKSSWSYSLGSKCKPSQRKLFKHLTFCPSFSVVLSSEKCYKDYLIILMVGSPESSRVQNIKIFDQMCLNNINNAKTVDSCWDILRHYHVHIHILHSCNKYFIYFYLLFSL